MHMIGIFICVPLYIILVLLFGASLTAGIFVFHVAVVPLIFKYSKSFRRNLVFANFVQWPPKVDFDDPSASGIDGARNLSIEYQSKVDDCRIKIGIWHILPREVYERRKEEIENITDKEELNKLMDEELAKADKPVMMYCHGNSNSRAAYHRIKLYKFFQELDFHTIAFDYRGYGDSSSIRPTESGVVEDSLIVYEWTVSKGVDICVWGHSLGTGISSHLLGNLAQLSKDLLTREPLPKPVALVLESPFNNMADEVAHHPLSKLVTWLPYYDASFVEPFRSSDHHFTSDLHMSKEKDIPVLILHAKDDVIVPFVVGNKLYQSIVSSRSNGGALVRLRAYEPQLDLGHKWICNAPDLHNVLKEFLENLKQQQ